MPCPASGTITIQDIVDEFGGSVPHALNEYYREGGSVPGNNTNVPTSGTISLTQFYSAVNAIVHTPSNGDTNLNLQTIFGSDWTSSIPKQVVIPTGVTVGGTNTHAILVPTGMGGSLLIDVTGNVHGYGGAAGAVGGDAIHCIQTANVTVTLNSGGNILAGGGGGGTGGAGGTGGDGGRGGNGGHHNKHISNSYGSYVMYAGGQGGPGGSGGSGGSGGAGGIGQGYNQSATAGSSGTSGSSGSNGSPGGPNAPHYPPYGHYGGPGGAGGTGGSGGQGGQGGTFGNSGATGNTGDTGATGTSGTKGGDGLYTGYGVPPGSIWAYGQPGSGGSSGSAGSSGAAGGLAGYYIFNRASITFNNNGTVGGR